ncbi:MAG: 50S ribosomal protein L9 [Nitrospina sp.]|nr:50S ribosomal protein L9 [Nitrospina sp.]
MKLLLKEDVHGLGSCGDEVEVKTGYGKNFLIPNGHAIEATPKNLKQFNHQKSIVQGRLKKIKIVAEAQALEIKKALCIFKKKTGDNGKIFGSVTTQDISESLRSNGIELDRRKLQLKEPIKSLGDFDVSVKLHPDVTVAVKVSVVQEEVKSKESSEPPKEETPS